MFMYGTNCEVFFIMKLSPLLILIPFGSEYRDPFIKIPNPAFFLSLSIQTMYVTKYEFRHYEAFPTFHSVQIWPKYSHQRPGLKYSKPAFLSTPTLFCERYRL